MNAPVYPGFKKNAKLEAGTAVLVPLVAKKRPSDITRDEISLLPFGDDDDAEAEDGHRRSRRKRQQTEHEIRTFTQEPRSRRAEHRAAARLVRPSQTARSWTDMAKTCHFKIMGAVQAEWFRRPVDEKVFRDYRSFVKHPIDLGTIRMKLELLQ